MSRIALVRFDPPYTNCPEDTTTLKQARLVSACVQQYMANPFQCLMFVAPTSSEVQQMAAARVYHSLRGRNRTTQFDHAVVKHICVRAYVRTFESGWALDPMFLQPRGEHHQSTAFTLDMSKMEDESCSL